MLLAIHVMVGHLNSSRGYVFSCLLPLVTVEEPPIPFSPFSLTDCTMLSHFSFNDFVAIAFPDIAGDLDIQI